MIAPSNCVRSGRVDRRWFASLDKFNDRVRAGKPLGEEEGALRGNVRIPREISIGAPRRRWRRPSSMRRLVIRYGSGS
jgi:hypothetical protein